MKNIYKVHEIAKNLLETNPKTRDSDAQLYLAFLHQYRPHIARMSFEYVLENQNRLGLPKYESFGRARRKIQAEHPHLCASEPVLDMRYEKYKEFKEYATH